MEAPLIEAILQGDTHEVENLLNMNANPNETVSPVNPDYERDTTALMVATVMRRQDIFGRLIQYGADVNAQNRGGWTALMIAASTNQLRVVKHLVKNGADLNLRTHNGHTALVHASMHGSIAMIQYLGAKATRAVVQDTLDLLRQIQDAPVEIILLLENILNKKAAGGRRTRQRQRKQRKTQRC
jgi:ankyrin repeat protein